MNIKDLYDKLDKIFIDHTTHNWKNGWPHEGDRVSRELTIQREVNWNNLFLLNLYARNDFKLDGPNGFELEVTRHGDPIRIDINGGQLSDIHTLYYLDNELDWECHQDFIVNLCQTMYDSYDKIKNTFSIISECYDATNPVFAKAFRRDRLINELLD